GPLFGGGISLGGGGSLVIENSTVSANVGGGLVFGGYSSLLMKNCTASANRGGGIYFLNGTVAPGGFTIRNSTFTGNVTQDGGGIYLWDDSGTILIQNSTITGNTATSTGTAIPNGGGGIN